MDERLLFRARQSLTLSRRGGRGEDVLSLWCGRESLGASGGPVHCWESGGRWLQGPSQAARAPWETNEEPCVSKLTGTVPCPAVETLL